MALVFPAVNAVLANHNVVLNTNQQRYDPEFLLRKRFEPECVNSEHAHVHRFSVYQDLACVHEGSHRYLLSF